MRVIAGEARGRRLEALPGTDVTRPTLSQVKEAMFSIVQFDLPGARVLDLYAGSGQLGIEALSRGAARCVFLDESREAVSIVMRNCKACGVFDRSRVNIGEAARFLSACREQFDLVLLDPPFRGDTLEKILPAVEKCVAPGGIVLCESETGIVLPAQAGSLTLQKQYKDTDKREKYRIYGELLNTYGYSCQPGDTSLKAVNYYNGEEITIPLDGTLSAGENAKKYFDRYGKLKRTREALEELLVETKEEIDHLESISTALDIALDEADLVQLKEELIEYGYIRRKGPTGKKQKITSHPFHYRSSEGFDIYVGKNNFQNEELSFKFASGNDWWFHAKGQPGSHVIVKTNGKELPDSVYEEAAALAAYYSKGRQAPKVEIDYTLKKNLRKPNGSKPGFVVYYTNYSMMAEPNIRNLQEIQD